MAVDAAEDRTRPAQGAALVAMLILAAALRLHDLGGRALWVDEAATLGFAGLPWAALFGEALWAETNPPTYYALVKLWLDMVGRATDAMLRMPSVICGVAAIPPFMLFCRRAFGQPAGLAGGLLLAASAVHVRYSQEARSYVLLFLLYVLGLLAAQALAEAKPGRPGRRAAILALGVLAAALVHVHATGVFAAASLFVFGIITLAAARRLSWASFLPFLLAAVLGAILALPALAVAALQALDPASPISWATPPALAEALATYRGVLLAPYLTSLAIPVSAFQAAVLLASLLALRRNPQAFGLLAALGFALATLFLASFVVPMLFERTVLFALAPVFALIAGGIGLLGQRRGVAVTAAAALVLLATQARALQNHYRINHYDEDWDRVAALMAEHGRGPDAAVALGGFEAMALRRYLDRADPGTPVVALVLEHETRLARLLRDMEAADAIWAAPSAEALCARFPRAEAIWTVGRRFLTRPSPLGPALSAALTDAGARREEGWNIGGVMLERWSALRCAT